jgi:Ribbon-helix-helix protein, copG family
LEQDAILICKTKQCNALRQEVAMSDQLTIRLPEDLSQALEAASARLRRKRSDIVRLALSQFLGLAPENGGTPSARVQHLIGSLETGMPDLAENHRAYILESLKHGG